MPATKRTEGCSAKVPRGLGRISVSCSRFPFSLAPGFSRVSGKANQHNRFSGFRPCRRGGYIRLMPGANEKCKKPRCATVDARINIAPPLLDKYSMTEAQIARQVAALPQDAQRLVLHLVTALQAKPAVATPARNRRRTSVREKHLGSVHGPCDLSTNKACRRATKSPAA